MWERTRLLRAPLARERGAPCALRKAPRPRGNVRITELGPRRRRCGLRAGGRASITQASLWGLGRVGKTALALEYAHGALEAGAYPGGIWWVVSEGRPLDAMVQLAGVVRQHAPSLMAGVREDASAEQLADGVRRALEAVSEPSLLVLDNVDDRGFAELLPGKPVRVLLITRDEMRPNDGR